MPANVAEIRTEMTVLITGSAGQLGEAILLMLRGRGHLRAGSIWSHPPSPTR